MSAQAVSNASVPAGAAGNGPGGFDPALLVAPFKDAKQEVTDAFEVVYLQELLKRNKGNITRSAHAAGLTRYHLRELLKRHQLSPNQ